MDTEERSLRALVLYLEGGEMTQWEERFFTLLLRTTMRPTRLPCKRLEAELEKEAHPVRAFWGAQRCSRTRRYVMLHILIDEMRRRTAPDFLVAAWWPVLLDSVREEWTVLTPGTGKRIHLKAALCQFKQQYDCATNVH